MSKLERLLNLTAVLLDTRRPLAADEIRHQVEGYPDSDVAFHRAFERDKDDLRTMGIPLRVARVPGVDPPLDGYRIPANEYYLPDPGLSHDELAALRLAAITVQIEGLGEPGAGREALWKLGGEQADGLAGGVAAGGGASGGSVASVPADPALVPLFSAITERRRVTFAYRSELRTVDPWRLSFQRGRWYLSGFDHLRSSERNYRIDRIEPPIEVVPDSTWSTGPTEPPQGRTLQAWELGEDEPTLARVVVDVSHAAGAAKQLGPDVTTSVRPDGAVEFLVPVINQLAFRSFLLGFLEHAELVEPAGWRDEFAAWLGALVR
ncbi:MAG: WYL domain-containing protein [Actinomycetota bacterium]|nr:WYL domain-containing protein [Actinomycetota bacterium]